MNLEPPLFPSPSSRGLHKGVREVFGDRALIQRCQWHKRENVTAKITDRDFAGQIKNDLAAAYAAHTYAQAKEILDAHYPQAAASLKEGLEETLTLHKLGIAKQLRDRLRTTNIFESINSRLARLAP